MCMALGKSERASPARGARPGGAALRRLASRGLPCEAGHLAVLRGRLDEARALLDEALDLGLAARSTPFVTLCLAACARLALAEDDPERAARLKGAAEGRRQRVGLPAWPDLRRLEEELVAQIRHNARRPAQDRLLASADAGIYGTRWSGNQPSG